MAWRSERSLALPALALAGVLPFLATGPAMAQVVPCDPIGLATTCTVSSTESSHFTNVFPPGVTVAAPNQPTLSSQLQAALAGPNGAALQATLANLGVLGPVTAPTLVAIQFTGAATEITTETSFGPATIVIGEDNSVTFFVPPGTSNVNTHTHVASFFNNIIQASQSLSARGVAYLTGDLHTTHQTTLVHDGFRFVDRLLSRGSAGGMRSSSIAFAPDLTSVAPFGDALAYAPQAPGAPMTASMGDGWQAWISGALGSATFDGTATNFGFATYTASVEGGVERVDGPWLYGAAFGFGHARTDQDATGDNVRINTVRGGIYASFRPGPWSFTGAAALGWSAIDATRLSLLPVAARSSYDAITLSAGFEVTRRFEVDGIRVEPLAGLVYTRLHVGGFTESGTTLLDLAGSGASIDALRGYVGGRVSRNFVVDHATLTPELRGRLIFDFLDDTRGYTARFIGDPAATPIPVTGIQPGRLAGVVGVALTARVSPGWQAFAAYDVELRENSVSHLVSGGLKLRW